MGHLRQFLTRIVLNLDCKLDFDLEIVRSPDLEKDLNDKISFLEAETWDGWTAACFAAWNGHFGRELRSGVV